eukprot:TRINITY_DN22967_c0_g2_i1.p1 TRINITY_DN22967_c0_g2~~TRINITY_DN22967_c0_g2_i1.p1  ORF type:complete len:617 (-),score=133.89 TRINITY_DN22967_c0_g2_i1:274-2124(-)
MSEDTEHAAKKLARFEENEAVLRETFEQCLGQMRQERELSLYPLLYASNFFRDAHFRISTAQSEDGSDVIAGSMGDGRSMCSQPLLEEPECVDMRQYWDCEFSKNCGTEILSHGCFHTGTTTSVKRTTFRNAGGYFKLVMEADSGEYYAVISKAQGCDAERLDDPNFIGWVRRYDGPQRGKAWRDKDKGPYLEDWEPLDNDAASFLKDISDESEEPFDVETLQGHLLWRELLMQARMNDKGKWSYVYVAQVEGEEYTLLNKGVRVLQTSMLETWNPPRAKSVRQDEKIDVRWMWFDAGELYYRDQDDVTYSVRYKELVVIKHVDGKRIEEPVWMDKNGLQDPHSGKYFPTSLVEHIAGRRFLVLPVSGVTYRDEDKAEEKWQYCENVDQDYGQHEGDHLTVSWCHGRWQCRLAIDRRSEDGVWEISKVETRYVDNKTRYRETGYVEAGVGMSFEEKTRLWFFTVEEDGNHRWWRCPAQIIEILSAHIKKRRRRVREGEIYEDQAAVDYDAKVSELVREVDEQSIPDVGGSEGQPRQYLCWICGDRAFNARHQLVDHIEGAGGGGKSHLKMRRRWLDAGQPPRDVWMESLGKNVGESADTDALPYYTGCAHDLQNLQ